MTDIFWTAIDKPTPSGRNARSHSRKPPTRARVSRHSARLLGKTVSGTDFGDRMGRGTVIVCNGLCSAAALSVRIAGAVSRSAARGKHCFGAPAEVSRPPWLGFVRCRNVSPRPRRFDEVRWTLPAGLQRCSVSDFC